jgi:hypothetical protein
MKAIVRLSQRIQLEIDERSEMETLHKAIVLSNPPTICNVCGKRAMGYDSNKDKEGNIYVNIRCSCGAKAKLGQYKAGGYFWREFEKYERKNNGQNKEADFEEELQSQDEDPNLPF